MSTNTYTFDYEFDHVPPVMRRGRQALIVIQDEHGHYLLGKKHIYPPGISRLIGGGINSSEKPLAGAVRELAEETGYQADPNQLKPLATIIATSTDSAKRKYTFTVYLYHLVIVPNRLKPQSDLDGIVALTSKQMDTLVRSFKQLPTQIVQLSPIPDTQFSWADYGRFFAQVHQLALKLTSQ